jgi:hypothetical protein
VPGVPRLPAADLVLNTGDNVYSVGSEDNYRDFFFPVYNSGEDSNEKGAPILRSRLFLPVAGNHGMPSVRNSAAASGSPRLSAESPTRTRLSVSPRTAPPWISSLATKQPYLIP